MIESFAGLFHMRDQFEIEWQLYWILLFIELDFTQ